MSNEDLHDCDSVRRACRRAGFRPDRSSPHGSAGQAFGAVTPYGFPGKAPMNAEREAAIRECNAVAAKWYPTRDSNISFQQYRMCMAQHGQME
jgi:hypothetical protein